MNLTPHFTVEELLHSDTAMQLGIVNVPDEEGLCRLAQLAGKLEDIRSILGVPIIISSGYRCPELNTAVGGAASSAHLYGCAADFLADDYGTPFDICDTLSKMEGFIFDQLINEEGGGARWVHVGLAVEGSPRNQCLTISGSTTLSGIVEV
jgi:hypothetical protein